ncbi:four helix bundle protein [Chryseobacterium ginsenosidimutans]|uniref:four helix bundle protein n=1 Tax=Chryseobacterium ginsenosidimutans TaxID=687846 RepID=UPI00216AAB2B|nr:four helix bundle protein [Chryseobacterium ginsenosidimutans]
MEEILQKKQYIFYLLQEVSLYELETQIYLSSDQNYLTEEKFTTTLNQIILCKKLLSGFINYYRQK